MEIAGFEEDEMKSIGKELENRVFGDEEGRMRRGA